LLKFNRNHELKLVEKELEDFIKPDGSCVIKSKLLAESNKPLNISNNFGPKNQIVSITEF